MDPWRACPFWGWDSSSNTSMPCQAGPVWAATNPVTQTAELTILHPADFEFTAGTEQLRHWDTRGEDGSSKSCHFCAVCGTRLLHGDPAGDEPVSIKGGSLDRTDDLEPIAHLWLRSAQPWIEIDRERYACFDTEPDSWASLMRRWQARSK